MKHFTDHVRSIREGNVFSRVCLSTAVGPNPTMYQENQQGAPLCFSAEGSDGKYPLSQEQLVKVWLGLLLPPNPTPTRYPYPWPLACCFQRSHKILYLSATFIVLGLISCVVCLDFNRVQSGLTAIPDDIPDGVTNILLSGNRIRILRSFDFSDLTSCSKIDLSDNFIHWIASRSFHGLPALRTLSLNSNGLTDLKKHMVRDLPNLYVVIFNTNLIKFIEDHCFASLFNLQQLHLADNALTELRAAMFHGLRNIKNINLDYNSLTSIDSSTFSHLPRPLELALDFNPFVCDSRLCWLKEEEMTNNITWVVCCNNHVYKPSCSGDVSWDMWQCSESRVIF